jgi:hypothetical protein
MDADAVLDILTVLQTEATDIQSREKIKSRYLNASLPEFYTFF